MFRVVSCLVSCLAVACVVDDPLADDALEESTEALTGPAVAHRPGVVQVIIPGDPQVRTGLLVAPDLVMVSRRWFHSGMVPSDLRIRHGAAATSLERQGWALTVNHYLPMAFIQVHQPFTSVPALTHSTRTPAQLVNVTASCFGFDNATTFGRANQTIVTVDGEREVLGQANPNGVEDHDAGAPCFDSGGALIGFVLDTRGSGATFRSRLFVTADSRPFLDNMLRLARARKATPGGLGFTMEYTANGFFQMCADSEHNPYDRAAASAVRCSGSQSQRWFFDPENTQGAAFLNAQTGTCIDAPNGVIAPNVALQLHRCHGGINQAFHLNWRDTLAPAASPTNFAMNPPRRTLCLVPSGQTSSATSRLEIETCTNQPFNYEQWLVRI